MYKSVSRTADPHSKSILHADQKMEQKSFQTLSESKEISNDDLLRSQGTQSTILKLKNSVSKKAETYFGAIDCDCGPDFYNRILGPTADEAFLRGLRTVFRVYNKYKDCKEPVKLSPEPVKSVPKVVSEILESIGLPPELVSEIVQTSFAAVSSVIFHKYHFCTDFSQLEQEKPELAHKILQTSTASMVSRILQTIGLDPELASQIVQTSFENLDKASLRSGVMQTTPAPSLVSAFMQTSLSNVSEEKPKEPEEKPKEPEKKPKSCVCCKCKAFLPDIETESIPQPEPEPEASVDVKNRKCRFDCPEDEFKICRCCECSAPVVCRKTKKHHDCICGKSKTKCKCRSHSRRHRANSCTYLALAKGDTCSLVDTTCNCDRQKVYYF
ncbi:uncharacterized protein [Tenebrio molitor]|uniref:uncharacterized protein isoform X2 n=1 Tax=Tenebrio molitor TaxID=7067 RepID=UPI003624943A